MKRTFYRWPVMLILIIVIVNLVAPDRLSFESALTLVVALIIGEYIGDGLFAVAQAAIVARR